MVEELVAGLRGRWVPAAVIALVAALAGGFAAFLLLGTGPARADNPGSVSSSTPFCIQTQALHGTPEYDQHIYLEALETAGKPVGVSEEVSRGREVMLRLVRASAAEADFERGYQQLVAEDARRFQSFTAWMSSACSGLDGGSRSQEMTTER